MARINHIYLINKGFFIIVTVMGANSQISADEALGSTIDCSEVAIDYIDRPDMTHSERLEAMDKAFFESVDHFELCNLSNQSSSSYGSANAANQASSAGSEAGISGTDDGETGFESVASSLMTGTETESILSPSDSSVGSGMPENTEDEAVAILSGHSY